MICKYFLNFYPLSLSWWYPLKYKMFLFWWLLICELHLLSLIWLMSYLIRLCLIQNPEDILLFFLRGFLKILLALIFKSMIHFYLKESNFILLHMNIPLSKQQLLSRGCQYLILSERLSFDLGLTPRAGTHCVANLHNLKGHFLSWPRRMLLLQGNIGRIENRSW